ncbi:hypothetical protein GGR50DRAFT_705287 [Xylaria sp. CBS 124048]|nr:hypothetical protein GGR50DRAFT_705287 [Xylaria sp. CBS 124048]
MASPGHVDLELGELTGSNVPAGKSADDGRIISIRKIQSSISRIFGFWKSRPHSEKQRNDVKQIEDYPSGYPQFSALIASHDAFHVFRRFSNLRVRLLLLKQDKISMLEEQLEHIDRESLKEAGGLLFLGNSRRDGNEERKAVLQKIDEALADYDTSMKRHYDVLGFETASHRNTTNLEHWVEGNGCIARAETAYLKRTGDLLTVARPQDSALAWFERLVEDGRVYASKRLGKKPEHSISRDPNVHIFSESSTARAARFLITPFVAILLLTPVIICNFLESLTARLVVIIVATTSFVAVLSGFTKVRTVELVVAGAT